MKRLAGGFFVSAPREQERRRRRRKRIKRRKRRRRREMFNGWKQQFHDGHKGNLFTASLILILASLLKYKYVIFFLLFLFLNERDAAFLFHFAFFM